MPGHPKAIKDEALRLYKLGFHNRDISLKLGVRPGTLVKWFAASPATRGQDLNDRLIEARKVNEKSTLPSDTEKSEAIHRALQTVSEALGDDGSEKDKAVKQIGEAYRDNTLPKLIEHMERTLQAPPVCKTIADVERLDRMIRELSGVGDPRRGGFGGLHVDVTVLSDKPKVAKKKAPAIEAEVIK